MSLPLIARPVIEDSLIAVANPLRSLSWRVKSFVLLTNTPTVPCDVGPLRLESRMVIPDELAITTPLLPSGSLKSTPSKVRFEVLLSSTLEKVTFAPAASVITALWKSPLLVLRLYVPLVNSIVVPSPAVLSADNSCVLLDTVTIAIRSPDLFKSSEWSRAFPIFQQTAGMRRTPTQSYGDTYSTWNRYTAYPTRYWRIVPIRHNTSQQP